jgi:hypothetical protein
MLGKFKPGWLFLKPLFAHVGVHAVITFAISIFLVHWPIAICLALGDAFIHFFMDRIKAGPKYMGRWKPLSGMDYGRMKGYIDHYESTAALYGQIPDGANGAVRAIRGNKLFWWALGLDQMVHHLTHYGIIYFIILLH